MGSSGGAVDCAHDIVNAPHATIIDDRTDDRIIPTRNEYRRSARTASVSRDAAKWRPANARIARPLI
jgi:hypothetical protein